MNNTSIRFIDVSHTVEHGMITYKGLPAPLICDYLSREASREHYAPGTEFHIGQIEMVANTGTYIDAPFHRFTAGKDLAELPLSSLAGLEGVVIRVDPSQGRAIGASVFSEMSKMSLDPSRPPSSPPVGGMKGGGVRGPG